MAKLNKITRLALQGMWLCMWRAGGAPQIRFTNQSDIAIDPQGLNVRVTGKVQHRCGIASSMMVMWGNHVITDLVAKLGGKRLTKTRCINIRSAAGEWCDIQQLAQLVRLIHIEAAQALNDTEAKRAANCIPPSVIAEHEDLDQVASTVVQPPRTRRL